MFIILLGFFAYKEANAFEMEGGVGLLSGEYSEGGALIATERVGKWAIGGGYVSKQVCHCRWPADLTENIFFQGQRMFDHKNWEMGLGAAYFQNTNRALGKNLTFSLSIGYRFADHWTVRIRHYSNAGSGAPNLGQDMLTVGYRY